jgi:hypothetical protein
MKPYYQIILSMSVILVGCWLVYPIINEWRFNTQDKELVQRMIEIELAEVLDRLDKLEATK